MSRHKEYVNPAGLRLDGRRPLESRKLGIEFGALSGCDGSCALTQGLAKVCASVVGPRETINRLEARHDEAIVTCDVAVAAFAGENRRNPQRRNKRCEDISAAIIQVARSVILLGQYPNSQIHISVDILKQDGDETTACINAACLALVDANVAMRDAVCCTNVGLLDNHVLLDLTTDELRSDCPLVSIAVTAHDTEKIIWMKTVSRLSPDSLQQLVCAAQKSATEMFSGMLRGALEAHAQEILGTQS